MKHKITAVLMALSVLLTGAALPAQAEETAQKPDDLITEPLPPSEEVVEENGLLLTIYTDYYTKQQSAVVKGADADAVSVTIPAAIRDVPVTGIAAGAFSRCTALREILTDPTQASFQSVDGVLFSADGSTLVAWPLGHGERYDVPEGTKLIHMAAFSADAAFDGLKEVTFPATLTQIGQTAFQNQAGLTAIVLPDSCQSVDAHAFQGCSGVRSLHLGRDLRTLYYAFTGCTALCEVTGTPKYFTIRNNVVYSQYKFLTLYPAGLPAESFTVPDGTTRIASGAFEQVAALKEVILPESVDTINDDTFLDMPALECVRLPEGTEHVYNAFRRCPVLKEVHLPSTLKHTGYAMLQDTPALTDLYYNGTEAQLRSISNVPQNKAIFRTGVTVHYLEEDAGTTVETDAGALIFCCTDEAAELIGFRPTNRTVKELVIPSEVNGVPVTAIRDMVFRNRSNFSSLVLPETLRTIGADAFYHCKSLQSVTFPEGLETIGDRAFAVSGLTEVTLPAGLTAVSDQAFYNCKDLAEVHFPAGLTTIGNGVFFQTALTEVELPEGLQTLGNGAFQNVETLTAIDLPESLTEIGFSCFVGCKSLEHISLPAGITELPRDVFKRSGLKELDIPATVQEIGEDALCSCEALEYVAIRNPDCVIYDSMTTICNLYEPVQYVTDEPWGPEGMEPGEYRCDLTIRGHENSTAQAYAMKYQIAFEPLYGEHRPSGEMPGDLDGDGDISIIDIVLLNKSLMVGTPLTDAQRAAADVNQDGKPDFDDALAMLKYVLEIITFEEMGS